MRLKIMLKSDYHSLTFFMLCLLNAVHIRATDAPTTTTTTRPITTVGRKPPPGPVPCRADQAMCQSGECISQKYLCDGNKDCSDGSDELKCGTPSPCEPNEFKCQNGRCALKVWRCDGDNDCQDNSDEIDCPAKRPADACAPEQFVCLSVCIPASYQCDEEPDCADRSDEYGCAPPTVTSPPEESVTAVPGQTVTFTCTAVGVPTPIITWRLNWGHIPVSSRISMTSKNGHGTLTIKDVKEGDQGAYTCEAINAKSVVFAIPDGVLTVSHVPRKPTEPYTSVARQTQTQDSDPYADGVLTVSHVPRKPTELYTSVARQTQDSDPYAATLSPITATMTTVAVYSYRSQWYEIVRWTLFTIMIATTALVYICTRARFSDKRQDV